MWSRASIALSAEAHRHIGFQLSLTVHTHDMAFFWKCRWLLALRKYLHTETYGQGQRVEGQRIRDSTQTLDTD